MLRSIVILAGISVLTACFVLPTRAPADLTAVASRKDAPDFTLADSTGAPVKLSAYKGRVVLLDFWATWCGGCKVEIPWYMDFQKKYKESGLTVVGVAMDEEGWTIVKPFVAETKINYPIVIGNSDLATRFGVDGLPVTLLIDRNGKIADSHAGMVDKDAFDSEIQTLLKDAGPRNDSK
jgi:cytochrome c biogenesis protein CcmG/thiol:disulfide interchange protein DsbE